MMKRYGLISFVAQKTKGAPPRVSFNAWENSYSSREAEGSQRHQKTLNGPDDPFGNTDSTFTPCQLLKT